MALALLASLAVAGCAGTDATSPTPRDLRPNVDLSADRSSAHDRSSLRIKFEKWFTTSPNMVGNTSYGPGTFSGKIIGRTVSADGNIIHLKALYTVTDKRGRSFTAQIEGDENVTTQDAVLDGQVIEGRLLGADVHVTFDVITPCAMAVGPSVIGTCFQGIIRVRRQK
jgi:hypothetical protein